MQKKFDDEEEHPNQNEFILNYAQNTKVNLQSGKLIGEFIDTLDSAYGWTIELLPADAELKTILIIGTAVNLVDNFGNVIESETELVINIYTYEQNLGTYELYGLFTYATVFNYMTLYNEYAAKQSNSLPDLCIYLFTACSKYSLIMIFFYI